MKYFAKPMAHRLLIALLLSALFISGCSSSDGNNGSSGEEDNGPDIIVVGDTNTQPTDPVSESPSEPETPDSTRVTFDITVPAYQSDSLQVRLIWDDKEIVADWVADTSWSVSEDFPTNTTHPLVVSFYDDNGAVELGRFEQSFTTGVSTSETVLINADQFNTAGLDTDNDGVSNFDEAIAGTDPLVAVMLDPVEVTLEVAIDKTFRISWLPSEGAEFYRVLENPDGVSGYVQISEELSAATQTFDHRVALYSRVNARYIVQACNTLGCVGSNEQSVSGTLEVAIGYFKASNTDGNDFFGRSISLSADGNTLAVGAAQEDSAATGINGDQSNNAGERSGAVYVFARNNGSWQQQGYLKASNADSPDFFGGSVSLSADGNTLAVGASLEKSNATGVNGNQSDNSAFNTGAVYTFIRISGEWQQQAYLKASNSEEGDFFGGTLSLSADGNTLAVGAFGESSSATGINGNQSVNNAYRSGAVYVFQQTNGNWQQQAYIKASNTDLEIQQDFFGDALSLSADGNTLAVGASREDSSATGINGNQNDNTAANSGAVYLFTRSNDIWTQQAYIKADNAEFEDFFGTTVSLSADGGTLAVGAPGEAGAATGINGDQNDNSAEDAGAVYLFTRTNDSWMQQAYVKASNSHSSDLFGGAVSLSSDGNTLAVGAVGEDSAATGVEGSQSDNSATGSGAVYLFSRNIGIWQQQAYVKASNSNEDDDFGRAISLSADGNSLAVGADNEDSLATGINSNQTDNSVDGAGAVYLY